MLIQTNSFTLLLHFSFFYGFLSSFQGLLLTSSEVCFRFLVISWMFSRVLSMFFLLSPRIASVLSVIAFRLFVLSSSFFRISGRLFSPWATSSLLAVMTLILIETSCRFWTVALRDFAVAGSPRMEFRLFAMFLSLATTSSAALVRSSSFSVSSPLSTSPGLSGRDCGEPPVSSTYLPPTSPRVLIAALVSCLMTVSLYTLSASSIRASCSVATRMCLTLPIFKPEKRTGAFFSMPSLKVKRTFTSFFFLKRLWISLTAKAITARMTKESRRKTPARISVRRYSMVTPFTDSSGSSDSLDSSDSLNLSYQQVFPVVPARRPERDRAVGAAGDELLHDGVRARPDLPGRAVREDFAHIEQYNPVGDLHGFLHGMGHHHAGRSEEHTSELQSPT